MLKAAEDDGVVLLPVIVGPISKRALQNSKLYEVQAVNSASTYLYGLEAYKQDEIWIKLAEQIYDLMQTPAPVPVPPLTPTPATPAAAPVPTSIGGSRLGPLLVELEQKEKDKDWEGVIDIGEHILSIDSGHRPARQKTAKAYLYRGDSFRQAQDYERLSRTTAKLSNTTPRSK